MYDNTSRYMYDMYDIVHIIRSLMMCTNTIVEVREMLIYSPRCMQNYMMGVPWQITCHGWQ